MRNWRRLLAMILVGAVCSTALISVPQPALGSAVETCSAPGAHPAGVSTDYRVWADGLRVPLYSTPLGHFGYFSILAPVRILVETASPLDEVVVRPSNLGIEAHFVPGSTWLSFRVSDPSQISVEVNGDITTPLFLFANQYEETAPSPDDPNVIYFPAGEHTIGGNGELVVGSDTEVYIACGAVVKGKIRIGAAKPTKPGAHNTTIRGPGIVDSTHLSDPGRPLRINNSSHIHVEGPIFLGKKAWGVVAHGSSHVTMRNAKVLNWRDDDGTGTPDGVDLVATSFATLDSLFIRSYDDAIAIKNHKNGWHGSATDITVTNATVWNGDAGNALEIGYETADSRAYVTNVLYENIDIIRKTARDDPYRRAAIGIHNRNGSGSIYGIRYEDIRIEETREHVIWIGSKSSASGKVRDILLRNVALLGGAKVPSVIQAKAPDGSVSDITFEGLTYFGEPIDNPDEGNFTITNADKVRFVAKPPPPMTEPPSREDSEPSSPPAEVEHPEQAPDASVGSTSVAAATVGLNAARLTSCCHRVRVLRWRSRPHQ